MAKPRCDRHKRSLPYCDACKEAVRVAEEAALQVDQDALAEISEAEEEDASAKQAVLEEVVREEESKALKEGVGFPGAADEESPASSPPVDDVGEGPHVGVPEEPADWDKNIDQAEETFRGGAAIDETAAQNLDSPVEDVKALIDATEVALAEEGSDTPDDDPFPKATAAWKAYEEKMRQEGRKDVIRMVREYYSDSIDTNAFQLLAYLEKACK